MNKSALKKFATEARKELLERVELQARKIGITADSIQKATVESSDAVFIDGKQLSDVERRQRNKLIKRIEEIGFDRVMEETAYTWFNRFIALRFMEVNDYLPTKVRVLSSYNADSAEPDMMKEALSLDLDLDKEYIYKLKTAKEDTTNELFKYLIKVHCNDLNRYMPFMFETIEDYKEILFPEGLLGTDSFVRQMTNPEVIAESDWESVEIIGWLYQYYISEEKDEVFANLKKNIKISKDKIPAATQLFTPNWIVRYMVENSLGRIWMESYPESSLKEQWKYYLDEAEQEEAVKKQLEEIRYKNVNPEEITFLDPCCGSGHILVYAFDVFYEMYLEKGYVESEIPQLILSKNLFGLDVDDRAVQLASFAVMMKARGKSRRIFRNAIKPNVYTIQESNWLSDEMIQSITDNAEVENTLRVIKNTFMNAKEYGSLLDIEVSNLDRLKEAVDEYKSAEVNLFEFADKELLEERLPMIIKQLELLTQKYDVVCTNPPYMGRSGMNSDLSKFLDDKYPDSKSDLFATFIERGFELLKASGFNSIVTMQSWMFLASYQNLREKIIEKKTITTLVHMDNMVMGIAFGTSATIIRNLYVPDYKGTYTEITYNDIQSNEKPREFPISKNRKGCAPTSNFRNIPGSPIAYWVSQAMINSYNQGISLGELASPKTGMTTADNNKFLRLWYEVSNKKIGFNMKNSKQASDSKLKWFPYSKGGGYRKWRGFDEYVVNWENDGFEIKSNVDGKGKRLASVRSEDKYFLPCITWSAVTSYKFSSRIVDEGRIFDSGGSSIFPHQDMYYLQGVLNNKITENHLSISNPTLNFQPRDIASIPVIYPDNQLTKECIENLVKECCAISENDWNDFETSWAFKKHPILKYNKGDMKYSFNEWRIIKEKQFAQLKINEEEINKIFIEMYGLQDELLPDVDERDVTISKPELERDIKSFISYAIGCSFGRYSLDEEGLIYAGGEFDVSRYKTFPVDEDNILPILSGAYFEDDIVTKFVDFVRITFSEETLEENLDFIADAIGRKKSETARETIRRYFLTDFYKDHVQTYKKRPIYWLFTSGKEKAFNCLIYMHRYDETTLSRIRTDYLHEVQIRMDAEKKDLLSIIEGDYTKKEISDAKKALKSLDKKIDELKAYDELLHHMADQKITIDLDDGVKHNYELFKGLVAKI
ncbi:BREX-1 system adenine-specific DNA-methyltransferase PglX [Kurthia gibsonii]|uniref:BREX-1 system adenine-specific DNA-methyltransferase PglX n=1 Tax=Kurthia gibsonii TaxID=33946 RepID=UPI002DBFA9CF|nr:BREX-1 system adenine-specific DNA-methyltransferase PglX [Kurthia gibsonii]MEB7770944.1 BREX-1 system adenine-specific DNA-methyltransferase PglX [Kurthia gibsonii]